MTTPKKIKTPKAPKMTRPAKVAKVKVPKVKAPKAPKTKPVFRQFFIDDSGRNKILLKSNSKTMVIYLQLESDGTRKRRIGMVTLSTKTITIQRKRNEHLFRNGNSYGFNSYLLHEAKSFNMIMFSDEFSNWKIPVDFILKNGEYLNFSQQGLELQVFITLQQMEQFRVLPKEGRRL